MQRIKPVQRIKSISNDKKPPKKQNLKRKSAFDKLFEEELKKRK